jgi:hypothetical protein
VAISERQDELVEAEVCDGGGTIRKANFSLMKGVKVGDWKYEKNGVLVSADTSVGERTLMRRPRVDAGVGSDVPDAGL